MNIMNAAFLTIFVINCYFVFIFLQNRKIKEQWIFTLGYVSGWKTKEQGLSYGEIPLDVKNDVRKCKIPNEILNEFSRTWKKELLDMKKELLDMKQGDTKK